MFDIKHWKDLNHPITIKSAHHISQNRFIKLRQLRQYTGQFNHKIATIKERLQ
jgi:hypothetical protein